MSTTKLNVRLITKNLGDELIANMQHAAGIYIMTSFIMQSGVRLLAPHLKSAIERGAEVKVLAGDYLFVTQPEGLRLLCGIDERLEARLWRSMGTSFHPKAYLFDYELGEGLLIVGSSNFSMSAMKMGMEWNLAMNAKAEPYTFQVALDKFMQNFYHESTMPLNEHSITSYEEEYLFRHRESPELTKLVERMEEEDYRSDEIGEAMERETANSEVAITPRFAQLEALEGLDRTLEEGYGKAMVVMATGLGKTYLAGFLAKRFKRVLFVAHREEILHQAKASFSRILPDRSFGFYNGVHKEADADCIFASIYTLGMRRRRESFRADAFDLIVVDEFHHAAAVSYRSVMDYFVPKFTLGITATPDRMDGKDVYALCDGNVAYQIHFLEAIRRGWLSPFRYFGVYDSTDYSQVRWLGSHYDEEQLAALQLRDSMAYRIYEAWEEHKLTRTIAFCSSIRQADYLADYFQERGVSTVSLHSGTVGMTRSEAIDGLSKGRLHIIFTVDLFNEGVDIPSVDTLLFVRPTESLTVFTQQVGRGLRLSDNKSHCHIIDLIGNYRNADLKKRLFEEKFETSSSGKVAVTAALPGECELKLDIQVIDLLAEISRKKLPRREYLLGTYRQLKHELGRTPTYLELHLHGRANSREYASEFGSYIGFLHWANELTEREQGLFQQYEAWLKDVEKTAMAKSYKMVVLLAMLERGAREWMKVITPSEAAPFFHQYLTGKEYRKRIDFSDQKAKRLWSYNEAGVSDLIAEMPMSKWSGARGSMTSFENGLFALMIEPPTRPEDTETLYQWTKDICLYRLHYHFERRGG
ncbi:DEAD/DEAH box helicase family protein [Paenibacillus sp. PAMC21692]|uniref:DEAD/DEAH box helicase family protein n=1 Tax=Paenibacillus sp. PAMC21692 TaxID=2762320 RepID=UPI00164CF985|nr:DEAD/DEAH box helicase family protein [Paenibacillus sp. PAMC21692]QNK57325.1 DEAD/DEAH box helicase family protein [Paenibacillus sp. PAMC21692]